MYGVAHYRKSDSASPDFKARLSSLSLMHVKRGELQGLCLPRFIWVSRSTWHFRMLLGDKRGLTNMFISCEKHAIIIKCHSLQ